MAEPYRLLTFDSLDSTNAEARRRARDGEAGPLWIRARRQTEGRGRRGRSWRTGEGDLAATLLITISKTAADATQMAFVAAIAVAEMAADLAPAAAVRVRWPNDVAADGLKIAGILIEAERAAAGMTALVVGVGVNLRQAPGDVEKPAGALAAFRGGDAPDPDAAMDALMRRFAHWVEQWEHGGFGPIRQAWLERADGIGGRCTARLEAETLAGVAEGLDEGGALVLRLDDGTRRPITAGDVFFGAGAA